MEIEQAAFVLHSRPYRESSALVTFLTQDYGKINGVVRGVRGGRKTSVQKSALLQPFQQLTLLWREKAKTTSDLISIQQIELAPLRFPLSGEGVICGLYENELLYRLLYSQVPVESLFEYYQQSLYHLAQAQNRYEQAWSLRQFEFQLLDELGFGLMCEVDAQQQPIEAATLYQFYPEMGAVKVLPGMMGHGVELRGDCLLKLAQFEYCEHCLKPWKRLLGSVLNHYLGAKPIMTRQLFHKAATLSR